MGLTLVGGSAATRRIYKSEIAAVAGVISGSIDPSLVNVSIGCQYMDSSGDLVIPTGGTVTILVKTENTLQWEEPPSNVITCATPTTVIVAGNIVEVQATPAAVAGGTVQDYQLVVTANAGL